MKTKLQYQTILEWYDPAGNRHAPGAVEALDTKTVFDLDHLIQAGTLVIFEEAAPVVDMAPAAPEIKEAE